MTPTDITPPSDQERRIPLHFIRTEVAARAGVAITGTSTWVAFMDSLEPVVKFGASLVALAVGLATLIYYSLAIVEKWRALRREDE